MIEIALLLARHGHPEYYNDVERFTRNYLVESQLVEIDWMLQGAKQRRRNTKREHFTQAPQMMRGGFVGRALPHDLIADGFLMGCCCGAGARALYQLWDQALTCDKDKLTVHLLINRRGEAAEVDSSLPHAGRVVVRNKHARQLRLRKPDWVDASQVQLLRNGRKSAFGLKDGYFEVKALRPGEEIAFEWPIEERRQEESLLKWRFGVTWRGDTVVEMTPRGMHRPLYQRSAMRTPEAPLRKKPPVPDALPTVHW
jgi:DUF1680 family protein